MEFGYAKKMKKFGISSDFLLSNLFETNFFFFFFCKKQERPYTKVRLIKNMQVVYNYLKEMNIERNRKIMINRTKRDRDQILLLSISERLIIMLVLGASCIYIIFGIPKSIFLRSFISCKVFV